MTAQFNLYPFTVGARETADHSLACGSDGSVCAIETMSRTICSCSVPRTYHYHMMTMETKGNIHEVQEQRVTSSSVTPHDRLVC